MTRQLGAIQAKLNCDFNEKLYLKNVERDITSNTNTLELPLRLSDRFSFLFKLKI